MAWFRTFIRRHLIADDPAPEYSRLDHHDGLKATPASTPTAAEELDIAEPASTAADTKEAALAAIQKRLTADEDEYGDGAFDQSIRDRRYLLALIREQAAKLDAIRRMTERAEAHGNHLLDADEVRAAITEPQGPRA
jgi:hypothetical protein